MKTLYLLRHAKSSWDEPGQSDHERPLNKRGRKAAPRMGELMAERDLLPDAIFCSTAVRAKETLEHIVSSSGYCGPVTYEERLYLAPVETYLELLEEIDDDISSVMTIAHNPGMAGVFAYFTGRGIHFPTAALARIEIPIESWRELESAPAGRLVEFWRPKELD